MKELFSVEREGIRVVLEASRLGRDVNVSISGGQRPHIGAVALAQARPSLEDRTKLSASTSVITVLGHKEDELARRMAPKIAIAVNGVATVACGIHIDGAERRQIAVIMEMVEELVEKFLDQLRLPEH